MIITTELLRAWSACYDDAKCAATLARYPVATPAAVASDELQGERGACRKGYEVVEKHLRELQESSGLTKWSEDIKLSAKYAAENTILLTALRDTLAAVQCDYEQSGAACDEACQPDCHRAMLLGRYAELARRGR
jgi:hypothetical protein